MARSRYHVRTVTRRTFLSHAGAAGAAAVFARTALSGAQETVVLPFDNGGRQLVAYPQKRPLIVLTSRPPQLETPFGVFNEGLLTPNDAFFVRYHLSDLPTSIDPASFRLAIGGHVDAPLSLSLADIRRDFPLEEVVAVNQCSGNGR